MIELLVQHPVWASACAALLILVADYAHMLYLRSKMVPKPPPMSSYLGTLHQNSNVHHSLLVRSHGQLSETRFSCPIRSLGYTLKSSRGTTTRLC